MRFIIAFLMLIVGTCNSGLILAQTPKDAIKIHFNGKNFTKPFPKTYDESVKTIKDLEALIGDFSKAVDKIDSLSVKTDTIIDSNTENIKKYTDNISKLTKKVKKV